MTPLTDEQRAEREEKLRPINGFLFKWRWAWTALFVFNLAGALWNTVERRAQWPSVFLTPDFAQWRRPDSLAWAMFCVAMLTWVLTQWWQEVFQYQRDQQRLAQEALLADANRQRENVWPPAPKKPEE